MAKPVSIFVAGPAPIDTWWFEFTPGVTVLYGRNGSGKTRLLSAIAQIGTKHAPVWGGLGMELVFSTSVASQHQAMDPGFTSRLLQSVLFPEGLSHLLRARVDDGLEFSLDIFGERESLLEAMKIDLETFRKDLKDLTTSAEMNVDQKRDLQERKIEVQRLLDLQAKMGWAANFADENLFALRRCGGLRGEPPSLWVATGKREQLAQMYDLHLYGTDNVELQKESWVLEGQRQINSIDPVDLAPLSKEDSETQQAKDYLFSPPFVNQISYGLHDHYPRRRPGSEEMDTQLDASSSVPRWAPVSVGPLGQLRTNAGPFVQVLADPAGELPQEHEWSEDSDYLADLTFMNIQSAIEQDLDELSDEPFFQDQELAVQIQLAEEEDSGATQAEIDELENRRAAYERQHVHFYRQIGHPEIFLFEPDSHPPAPSNLFVEQAQKVSAEATQTVQLLLLDGPELRCEIQPVIDWADGPPIRWWALPKQSPGSKVGFGALSAAERRWCTVAIRLASGPFPDLILIDEPERGLHLRAQRHLANGLKELGTQRRCPVVVSSHSPEMLRDSENRLVHVTRNAEGNVRTHAMTAPARENLDEMGLDPVDVLQLTERFVIVEGEHDKIALDVFLGDHLADLRAVVLPMRGTTNLASTVDSQFLWDFTSAGVVIVLDNTRAELARQMLSDLHRAVDGADQEAVSRLLDGWKPEKGKGLSDEEKKLGKFLKEMAWKAALDNRLERLNVFGFEKEDIVEYFDCATLVPGHTDWEELREMHRSHGGASWKAWLANDHNAVFEPVKVHEAAQAVADSPPREFFDLLEVVRSVPHRSTTK